MHVNKYFGPVPIGFYTQTNSTASNTPFTTNLRDITQRRDAQIDDVMARMTTRVKACVSKYPNVDDNRAIARCVQDDSAEEANTLCFDSFESSKCLMQTQRTRERAAREVSGFVLRNQDGTNIDKVLKDNKQDYRTSAARKEIHDSRLDFLKQNVPAEHRGSAEAIVAHIKTNPKLLSEWKALASDVVRKESDEKLRLLSERYEMKPDTVSSKMRDQAAKRLSDLKFPTSIKFEKRSVEMLRVSAERLAEESN